MSNQRPNVWTDERVETLRKLWADGLTTGEIGKRLGVSKNAVVGKAHRLGLKSRPSPIKRTKKKLPVETKVKSIIDLGPNTCRWPHGDPKEPGFHFCGKRSIPGKPYCPEHAAIAYVGMNKPGKDEDKKS
jgi:GcrA cell cycle regulator